MRARFLVPILCCALGLDGCAGLPPLEEATGGIPVREIVLRVKCELSDAFMLGEPGEPGWWLTDQPNFAWMKDWITQSDLTLEILDTAGFSPGVTLKQPLFNGWATSAGPATMNGTAIPAIPQSFADLRGGKSERLCNPRGNFELCLFFTGAEEVERKRKKHGTSGLRSFRQDGSRRSPRPERVGGGGVDLRSGDPHRQADREKQNHSSPARCNGTNSTIHSQLYRQRKSDLDVCSVSRSQ